ncbi:MAG: hypothetical protein WAO83_14240 [Fuerstiella sp.]
MSLKTDERKAADKMSRDERLSELAKILARGYMRFSEVKPQEKARKTGFPALSSPAQRGSL